VIISTVMHFGLLVVVGPLGLHHKPAVLLWNIFFIVQNWLVFWHKSAAESSARVTEESKIGLPYYALTLVLAVAVLWPLLEPLGLCDHWLAWGLYAPRASRVSLFVNDAAADSLPEDLQSLLDPDNDSGWRELYLDRWSLAAHDVPIYPQARVQLAIAAAVVHKHSLVRTFQVVRFSTANRWTGEREHEILRTPEELQRASERYILNARAILP
jgi:hypothetical protein